MRLAFALSCVLILLNISVVQAADDTRFVVANLSLSSYVYEPTETALWRRDSYVPLIRAEQNTTPIKVNGSVLHAPEDRKNIMLPAPDDRLSRVSEQRLIEQYGTAGWQSLAIDGQMRFGQAGAGLVPYVTGGMGVTQVSDNALGNNDGLYSNAVALRYGAGLAYSVGDDFDLTAGYRVNRMTDDGTVRGAGFSPALHDRLNVQMLDFGLRYRY